MAFEHIREPVGRIMGNVIDMKSRAQLMRALRGSVEVLRGNEAYREAQRIEAERGRHLITKGLNLIRDNESPQSAIEYLRGTLAAIDGSDAR